MIGTSEPTARLDQADIEYLAASLADLDGVEQVIQGTGGQLWLRCDPQVTPGRMRRDAEARIAATGADPGDVALELVVDAATRERRMRFDSVERVDNLDRSVTVRVTLEWEGDLHTAEITGEKGEQIELRTAAHAALAAVENVTGEALQLRLVGVKNLRAFDGELVVVSIFGGESRRTMLGAVLAGSDPFRATAIAVLMALNRLLGNYLVTR